MKTFTLAELLSTAESNIDKGSEFSLKVGNAQMAMYKDFKKMGYSDEDDTNKLVELHPKKSLNNYILNFQ